MIKFKFGRGIITVPHYVNFITLESIEFRVGLLPLNMTWNHQMALDIQAFHNIDAEAELTRILTEEIGHFNISRLNLKIPTFKFGRSEKY